MSVLDTCTEFTFYEEYVSGSFPSYISYICSANVYWVVATIMWFDDFLELAVYHYAKLPTVYDTILEPLQAEDVEK